MLVRRLASVVCLVGIGSVPASAFDEAGNSFAEAEELDFGQLSVSAELLVEFLGPDLYLGIRDEFGDIYLEDNDSSDYGDSYAPGLYNVPVNPGGEIAFAVTGYADLGFSGDHIEFGDFEAFIDIFTFVDDEYTYVDGFIYADTIDDLDPESAVLEYSDTNAAWEGAVYDIQFNNAFPNDIDFWRFVGLTPGETFTAETLEVEGGFIDTALGWFNESGDLIASDDDSGLFNYSKLSGTVPGNGEIVLAVTGYEDLDLFEGAHRFKGPYELAITLGDVALAGDYDGDSNVDLDDYVAWEAAFGTTGPELSADGNGDGVVDAADYTIWRDAFETQASPVPEPAGVFLVTLAAVAVGRARA